MTSPRDTAIEAIHNDIVQCGLARTAATAVHVRLAKKVLGMLVAGRQKWEIVDMLNKEARMLGSDLHDEADKVYDVIKDVDI